MEKLLNKIISKVELSDDEQNIVFTTNVGEVAFAAYGECCSISWIAHISGIKSLIGEEVNKIDDSKYLPPLDEAEEEGVYDFLELYGYDLHTDRGICTIEFRNDSNGYYGGSCEDSERRKDLKYREIKEDF